MLTGRLTGGFATMKNRTKRGFTLMEMLITVAIIAVLVIIAIPTFSNALHKARVAADMANVRAYYAQLQADYLLTGEYAPGISDDMWASLTDTITFNDGKVVKLQAGWVSVIYPSPKDQDKLSGYQAHYFCSGKDGCTLTLGASDSTSGS